MQRMTRRQLVRAGLVSTGALLLGGAAGRQLVVPRPALAATYDSFTVMALTVAKGFSDWCAAHGVQGAITETGVPEKDGAVWEAACTDWQQYNAAYGVWYQLMDQLCFPVTPWCAGRVWGNDPLAIYSDGGTNGTDGSWYIDTVRSSAAVVEAHTGPLRGTNLDGADFPGPNNGQSTMTVTPGWFSSGNPGIPDGFDSSGNQYAGDYYYPMGPNAHPTQPAPIRNDWAFIYGRGVRLIRFQLPSWERLQPTLGQPLNTAELGRLQAALADAAAANTGGDLKLILDLHCYCRYTVIPPGGTTGTQPTEANGGVCVMRSTADAVRQGNPASPGMLTAAHLADFWSRMTAWVEGLPANLKSLVYALSLQNEPHDLYFETAPVTRTDAQVWEYCSQQAVSAIRAAGWTGQVYVGGYNWQSAFGWGDTHAAPWIDAALGPITYDAHQYHDPTNGGGMDYKGYSTDNSLAASTSNYTGVAYGTTWDWTTAGVCQTGGPAPTPTPTALATATPTPAPTSTPTPTPSGGAPRWVQGGYASPQSGTTATVTLSGVAAGDVLVATVCSGAGGVESGTPSSSGPAALTWTKLLQYANPSGSDQITIWRAPVATAGAYTVTATVQTEPGLAVDEYAGIAGTLAASGTASGSSTTPSVTTSVAVPAGALVLGAFTWSSGNPTITAGAGYTLRQHYGNAVQSEPVVVEDAVTTAAGTVTASLTLSASVHWTAVVVALT